MEIRENPYDDLDVGDGKNDRSAIMTDIQYGDDLGGELETKPQRDASPLTLKLTNTGQNETIQTLGM